MTVTMDIWDTISETKDQNEKKPESLHSDDGTRSQEYSSVICSGPKGSEPDSTIPSPEKKCKINALGSKKGDAEREDASGPGTSCKCTLCDVVVTSPHSLTQHIRQHNVNNQTNTCRICRKTLSSASSLDRHMLVHSGERPFKCKLCNMAFTTNGNMHRHMRTHGEATGDYSETASESKEIKHRHGLKRRLSSESDSSYSNQMETGETAEQQKELACPVCAKTFLCKYGLQNHMETHPNDPIKCPDCLIISPDYAAHVKHQCLAIRNANGNIRVGFHDLSFVDFSTDNFSLVAKSFCEQSSRQPSSAFHKFECVKCNAAFPCGRALKLHEVAHSDKNGTYCLSCKCDFPNPSYFYAHQLKHRSVEDCWNEIKMNSNKDDSNKDDFLVLFGLKTTKGPKEEAENMLQIKEEQFENLSYFVFGSKNAEEKPADADSGESEQEKHGPSKQSGGSDFADIQSIISLTSNTPLMPSVRSSPAMASPASPSKITSCALPESPAIADSAQASPETPSKDDDCIVTKEPPVQNDTPEELSGLEQNPSKRQKITVFQSKSYSCHKCKYTSLDKGTLRRHLRTHNGERPFQCTVCSYAFTTKANCERHVRKCHKITEKEEVASAMRYNPNMTETKDSDIQSIESTSLETVCKYCNVDFKNQRVLRHHLRSLNNSCSQKPFLCTVCKSGFSTKNNCMRHIAKQHPHLKEKPSEAVLVTASNASLSSQENTSSTERGTPNFIDEPLNLSVREAMSDMEIERSSKSDVESIEDIVNAAKGLVSLSEMPPPQEQPLDLTLHPLDLTTKKFLVEDSFDNNSRYTSPTHGNLQQFCSENSCSPNSDFFRDSMVTPSPILSEESQQAMVMPCFKTSNQSFFPNTDRQFICRYCSAGFTLKSNMERHIKRKHPEYARPTRSRNYVSTISLGNEKPTSGLAVSTQTRNALRFVLNNKALSSSNQELSPENLSVQQQPESLPTVTRKSDASEGQSPGRQPHDAESTVDLASISDVIDTANSQEFKRYLKESRTDAKSSLTDSNKSKEKKSCASTNSQMEKFITRKRNSYADSPNSIACPYCKRRFPWRSSLRRHVLTHTGQKPFKCPKCPIWFTTKSNCERHFGRKHKINNDFGNRSVPERPYKCHLCTSSTFSTQGNLRKHFYLKHWTKTRLGKNHLSEFLSSPKDTTDTAEDESKDISSLPVISECDILNKFHSGSEAKLGAHSPCNGIFYLCHYCYRRSYTREECLEHLLSCYVSHKNSVKGNNISEEPQDIEKEVDADKGLVNSGDIEDGAQSKIACAFCSNVFSFRDEFLLHMEVHIRKLEDSIVGPNSDKKNGGQQSDLCNSSLLNTRNRRSNSLLYLMQSGKAYNSAWNLSEWNRSEQNEDNTDLIQNLLGIQDSKMIDEMLDSADSAARLLGVEEV